MTEIYDLVWQNINDMPQPTNALQELVEILTRTSRDTGEDKMIACIYGIIVGWDDNAYKALKEQHGWIDDNIRFQKMWHENYKRAWSLFMEPESADGKRDTIEFTEWISEYFRRTYPIGETKALWFKIGYNPTFEKRTYTTIELYNQFKRQSLCK